jgi:hypothetical protein
MMSVAVAPAVAWADDTKAPVIDLPAIGFSMQLHAEGMDVCVASGTVAWAPPCEGVDEEGLRAARVRGLALVLRLSAEAWGAALTVVDDSSAPTSLEDATTHAEFVRGMEVGAAQSGASAKNFPIDGRPYGTPRIAGRTALELIWEGPPTDGVETRVVTVVIPHHKGMTVVQLLGPSDQLPALRRILDASVATAQARPAAQLRSKAYLRGRAVGSVLYAVGVVVTLAGGAVLLWRRVRRAA